MEYYSAIKKQKVLPFVTVWMDLKNIMLSEIDQAEEDKYHMIHSCVESNEQTTNKENGDRLIDVEQADS